MGEHWHPQEADPAIFRDLIDHLAYDPATGVLTWNRKLRGGRKAVGTVAGTLRRDGYLYVCFRRRRYLAHRLCWAIYHGSSPAGIDLDHVNGDRADNRIANLRSASSSENNRNKGKQPTNTTGFKGVHRNRRSGKFSASVNHLKVKYSLGMFDRAEDAARAYDAAVVRLHGEFARLNFPAPANAAPASEFVTADDVERRSLATDPMECAEPGEEDDGSLDPTEEAIRRDRCARRPASEREGA